MSQNVSWGKPLALAVTLVVIGTGAYWLEFSHKPKSEEKEEQEKKILNLKDVSVSALRLTDGSKDYSFKCVDPDPKLCKPGDNSKWEVTAPVKLKADESNLNSLLSAINSLQSTEVIDLSEDTPAKRAKLLKEYGLDAATRTGPGSRRVEITPAQGEKKIAFLGDTHPIGDTVFSLSSKGDKVDENKVYLVPSYFKSNFDHDLTYWRDKKLLSLGAHQIAAFRLDDQKAHLEAYRKDGQWVLRTIAGGPTKGKSLAHPSPIGEEMPGDIENIDNLLSVSTYLSAKNFVADSQSDPKAKAALQGAKVVLTLELTPEPAASPNPRPSGQPSGDSLGTPVTLTFFEKGKALYATVSGADPLYELEPRTKERLDKGLYDLRLTKLITSMERYTAKRFEFAGTAIGANPVVLTSSDSKWSQLKPMKREISNEKIQDLLDKLSGNRIKEFQAQDPSAKGRDTGLTLTLGDDKNEKKRQLFFWKDGDKLYAQDLLAAKKETLVIDPALRDALPWSAAFFSPTSSGPQQGIKK